MDAGESCVKLGNGVPDDSVSAKKSEAQVGLCTVELAQLPKDTLVDECVLATHLKTSPRSIRRYVASGQLPPGNKLGGRRVWMIRQVIEYLAREADRAAKSARRLQLRRSE